MHQIYLSKYTKPNLFNQTYKTKSNKPILQNQKQNGKKRKKENTDENSGH